MNEKSKNYNHYIPKKETKIDTQARECVSDILYMNTSPSLLIKTGKNRILKLSGRNSEAHIDL